MRHDCLDLLQIDARPHGPASLAGTLTGRAHAARGRGAVDERQPTPSSDDISVQLAGTAEINRQPQPCHRQDENLFASEALQHRTVLHFGHADGFVVALLNRHVLRTVYIDKINAMVGASSSLSVCRPTLLALLLRNNSASISRSTYDGHMQREPTRLSSS